jgi:putative copper resistance protein D
VIPLLLLWLRAAGLLGETVAVGATMFALVVLRAAPGPHVASARGWALGLAAVGATAAALAQGGLLAALAATFGDDATGWPTAALLGSSVGAGALVRIAMAIAVVVAALALYRTPGSRSRAVLLVGAVLALSLTGTFASHAMGRLDGRAWLLVVTALHQLAAGVWVGGLVCAALLAVRTDRTTVRAWLRPFSAVAVVSVGTLALSGLALGLVYVVTPELAVGTSYGSMVLTKSVLFTALLVMGALNHRAVHGRAADDPVRLSRRLEVEAGLAVVAVLLAASIGSASPAIDVGAQATPAEIRALFTPQWPRLSSPSLAELAAASDLADPDSPRTAEITAWSEFGHNVAGLFVLAMGVLATLHRTGRAPWARHWPLLLIGLAGFVAYSVDPEGWQTGAVGFWEHWKSPEVLQHRVLLGLTALLGLAEWRVHNGRPRTAAWRYVFPAVTIGAGVLLLTHVHEVSSGRSAFFMELSHLPLGLLSLLAGWSRWLELRLPPGAGKAGRVWGPALAAFGLLLIFYREP